MFGDLEAAEDAVQDACLLAVARWPATGVPANPGSWLIGTARHKLLDRLRREGKRAEKEAKAMRSRPAPGGLEDDELGLIFMCCHPALDPEVRIALTLRCVCGLPTAEIAAAFLIPEPTMAQRLVRAKRKIRQAGIAFRVPRGDDLAGRLGPVLRVVYLVFTQGHMAAHGEALIRGDLCDQAIRLARALARLLPGEPEVAGLLALLLLTDARRAARLDGAGELVPLQDQDRGRWDRDLIREGEALLAQALRAGRPGPYQVHAAIAACHSGAALAGAGETDWHEVAALYEELVRYEPTPVVEANRAVAVAMAEGPAAGLGILDTLGTRLVNWPQFHIARAELLRRLGRAAEARDAYRAALRLALPRPEQAFLERRIRELLSRGTNRVRSAEKVLPAAGAASQRGRAPPWTLRARTGSARSVAVTAAAGGGLGRGTRRRSRAGDRHLVPQPAGDVEPVALVLPGAAVRGVGVERMPVVGGLCRAVRPGDGA
jgi:RNA polymerase sigma-70 factor (ECF subfamily)